MRKRTLWLRISALCVSLALASGCSALPRPVERFETQNSSSAVALVRRNLSAFLPLGLELTEPLFAHLSDPSAPGRYETARFTYGSAGNPRRPEYRVAAVETEAFDLSPFHESIDSAFWGYDVDSVPVNGIVWYPVGDGPFPLFIVVHGNHPPGSFSEPGYDYLGELLASRGIVTVSVDQNMLNGSHRGENGARAIFLLEHARRILKMHENPGTPLSGRLDPENIVISGHSRGGEAAALAAMLNEYTYYPGDGTVPLDYRLPIRGVVSIAPVEGQYRPAERELPIPDDVHFLVLHGSQDGDVSTHHGLRFFYRGETPDSVRQSVWIYGANHAQFNTSWSRSQDPIPSAPRVLLSAEQQQRAAAVFISSFLEVAFGREPLFQLVNEFPYLFDEWLPQTETIAQFRRSAGTTLNSFEDDARFETASLAGWRNEIDGAESWREYPLTLTLDSDSAAGTYGLEISWDDEANGGQTVFRVSTGDTPFAGHALGIDIALTEWDSEEKFDAQLFLTGADGSAAHTSLSTFSRVDPTPEVGIMFVRNRHTIPRTVYIPFSLLEGIGPGTEIEAIELRLPRASSGTILLPRMILYGGGA